MKTIVAILALSLLGACGQQQQQARVGAEQAKDSGAQRANAVAEVDALADELLEHWRATNVQVRFQSNLPVTQIEDFTFDQAQKDADYYRAALPRLKAIDLSGLPEDRWVLARLLEHTYEQGSHAAEDYWLTFVVTPYSGAMSVLGIQRVLAGQKFETADDLQRYLKLVDEYAAMIDQMAAKTREQAERGIRVPKPAIPGVRTSLSGLRGGVVAALDVAPTRTSALVPADVASFRSSLNQKFQQGVLPAYDRILAVFDDAYVAAAPERVGLSQYPGGKENYLRRIAYGTGLSLTPQEIHDRGLAAVADLDAQKKAIREELKFQGDRDAFEKLLRKDKRFIAKTPADVEKRYLGYVERMAPKIPGYFSVVPKAPYGVKRLDPAAEPGMTYGFYREPSPDNPAGTYFYNGSNLDQRSLVSAQHLIYHELIPGHHLHLALQAENETVHPIREFLLFGAFTEGWAEYAASLGSEMGLYSDPYDRYGHLLLQSMLATRLVVDTGMNYFDWPLEKARAYMKEHTFESDVQIASETLRYSTDLFAQALDYRLGYDQFWQLRREAEAKLGERFDIRRFHAAAVGDGAMPLDVLTERIERFIAGQRDGE
jgi:uncharacterized protein (DUF885 family)